MDAVFRYGFQTVVHYTLV